MTDTKTIPNTESDNLRGSESSGKIPLSVPRNAYDQQDDTLRAARNTFAAAFAGDDSTESDNGNIVETTIKPTELVNYPTSMQGANEPTLPTGSQNSSISTDAAISKSITLLRNTGEHLFEQMLALSKTQASNEVRLVDMDRVQTAVLCANGIKECLKTMNDLIKTQRMELP